jgi:hypothetical protein
MIRTLNLHLLLVSTDHAEFFRNYAESKGVGLGTLCRQIATLYPDWVDRLFESKDYSVEDLIHDFVGLLKVDEHFIPRI